MTSQNSERERFEAWLAKFRELAPMRGPVLWEAWQAALSAPSGYVMVPVEPTPEMLAAMIAAMNVWIKDIGEDADIYAAVIAAAPKEPT